MKYFLLSLYFLFFGFNSFSQTISLDSTFGVNGIINSDPGFSFQEAIDYASTSDGKIICVVNTNNLGGCYLIRFLASGSVDESFGDNGLVTISNDWVVCNAIVVDGNNNIYVLYFDASYYEDTYMAKVMPDGNFDESFGDNGLVKADIVGYDITLAEDGKIVIAGNDDPTYSGPPAVERFESNGSPDSSFGNDGVAKNYISGDPLTSARVESDGSIICLSRPLGGLMIVKFSFNGDLDSSFNQTGYNILEDPPFMYSFGAEMSFQQDGKILACGRQVHGDETYNTYPSDWVVWRFLPNGLPDSSFGISGKLIHTNNFPYAHPIATFIQANDDSSIFVGGIEVSQYSENPFITKLFNDGSTDSSFGTNGMTLLPRYALNSTRLISADADSMMLGTTVFYDGSFIPGIFKLTANGTFDSNFGEDGVASYEIQGYQSNETGVAVKELSDGKILSAFQTELYDRNYLYIYRHNNDGTIDTTYQNHGLFDGNPFFSFYNAQWDKQHFLETDSNLFLVTHLFPYYDSSSILILRMDKQGNPDSSFGTNGYALVTNPQHIIFYWFGAATTDDGKILIYVDDETSFANTEINLIRLNQDGSIDPSFGTNGSFTLPCLAGPQDVSVRPDGKILVSAIHDTSFGGFPEDLIFALLTPGGIIDSSFGVNGILVLNQTSSEINQTCLLQQPDGKVIVGELSNFNNHDIHVWRFNEDLSLDDIFGSEGKATISVAESGSTAAYSYALQSDGKILLTGTSYNLGDYGANVLRLTADGQIDNLFDDDGLFKLPSTDPESAYLLTLQDDGKILVSGQHNLYLANTLLFRLINNMGYTDVTSIPNENELQLFPVPAHDKITVVLNKQWQQEYTISVVDVYGKTLEKKEIDNTSLQNIELDVSEFSQGVYFITVDCYNEKYVGKFVKE